MRIEQQTVDQVAHIFHGTEDLLHAQGISMSNRLSLANEAAATGVNTDELAAMMEYRTRRAAQQSVRAEEEAEVVA